jgi:hypothetical protein
MSHNWELIDENPHNGLKKYLGDNPDDPEGVLVRYEQDAASVQRHIDQNKTLANHVNTGKMGDMEHVASIPIGVMYEWKVKYGVDAWKYTTCLDTRRRVNRLLNDSDYRYLKTRDIII